MDWQGRQRSVKRSPALDGVPAKLRDGEEPQDRTVTDEVSRALDRMIKEIVSSGQDQNRSKTWWA